MENLKDYKAMNLQEQEAWLTKFDEFTEERLPLLCAIGSAWEANAVKSLEEGLHLMTAFGYCRDFVQKTLYFRDFSRRIERVKFYVERIRSEVKIGRSIKGMQGDTLAYVPPVVQQASRSHRNEEQQADASAHPQADLFAVQASVSSPGALLHLDQIAWLLSPTLREEVKLVQSLRATAAKESNQAKELAERGVHEDIIKPHAQAAVDCTNRYKGIYAKVDSEMAHLYAALMADSETSARYTSIMQQRGGSLDMLKSVLRPYWEKCGNPQHAAGETPRPDPELSEEERSHRILRLHAIRTYILRKDVKITDKRMKKMKEYIEEARSYGEDVTAYEKILESYRLPEFSNE